MASIRSQPATCKDGEMRATVTDSSILVTGHGPESGWRRCTSSAAFQRWQPSMASGLLLKKCPSSNASLMTSKSPSLVLFHGFILCQELTLWT